MVNSKERQNEALRRAMEQRDKPLSLPVAVPKSQPKKKGRPAKEVEN